MKEAIDVVVDVTEAVGLGHDAHTVATVHLPDQICDPPVICFGFPGGGYGRKYYSFDMPGASGGGQAGFHTSRGWVFVSCDHLGVGDSTVPEGNVQTMEMSALANKATVEAVLAQLRSGSLADSLGDLDSATLLALGQSMGGCFTIVLEGQHHVFDGVGILGYSGIHTVVPSRPGSPAIGWPWIVRSSSLDAPTVTNAAAIAAASGARVSGEEDLLAAAARGEHPFAYSFHYDDVPADVVEADLYAGADDQHPLLEWRSATAPPCAILGVSPGIVAAEAAAITVPVLMAFGERDVSQDPWMEPKAFKSSRDITVFVCERMAHMHNFASTREKFWTRIHSWGSGVAADRAT